MVSKTNPFVAAVIVVFNPDERFQKLLSLLIEQVTQIWIIDNGSSGEVKHYVKYINKKYDDKIETIVNSENKGLAAAQNQGIKEALRSKADWILLLDQDSVPAKDMVRTMLEAAMGYSKDKQIGFLTPRHEDDEGKPSVPTYSNRKGIQLKRHFLALSDVDDDLAFGMASGSLIPSKILREVGLMREEFWIDYIDYDFSFRVKKLGYRILGVGGARLSHRLGEIHKVKVLGKSYFYHAHPASRRYTIYKNRITVIKEYGMCFPAFFIFEVLSISKDLFKLLLVESQKIEKSRAILKGILNGLSKRANFGTFNEEIR